MWLIHLTLKKVL